MSRTAGKRLAHSVVVVEGDDLGVAEQAGANPELGGHGIAREQAEHHEDDHGHAEERDEHAEQAPGHTDQHGDAPPSAGH